MLGLRNGLPGARRWRQVWSDHRLKTERPSAVSAVALGDVGAAVEPAMT
jgi:tRNA-dihydrouridine synthase A